MSRLYIKTNSDASKTGRRAHYKAKASLYWGSRDDSRLAASIEVYWPKGEKVPQVIFVSGKDVNVNVLKVRK